MAYLSVWRKNREKPDSKENTKKVLFHQDLIICSQTSKTCSLEQGMVLMKRLFAEIEAFSEVLDKLSWKT